jgi:putative inorganic carbon (HCO3(-)) transporter
MNKFFLNPSSLTKFSLLMLSIFLPFSISGISISVSLLFLGYLVLCFTNRKIVFPSEPEVRNIIYLIIIFVFIMVVSTIFSSDKISSVKRTITVAGYFIIFVGLSSFEDKNFVKKCLKIFVLLCVIHSVYAIVQYFTGIDIVHKGYQKYSRVIGVVGHFNSLAGILGLVFPVVVSFFYFLERKKVLNLVYSIILLAGIVLTFTRGIWLGTFFAFLVLSFLFDKRLVFFILLFSILIFLIPQTKKRILSTFESGNQTTRIYFLKETPKLVLKQFVLGYGPDSFRKVFYEHYLDFPEQGHFHPHNMYLHILFELGILGLLTFLVLFYKILEWLIKVYYLSQEKFVKSLILGTIGSVIVFLIYGFVDEPFRAHFAPYVLFFLLGVSFNLAKDQGFDTQK